MTDPHPTKTYIAIDLKSFYASVECMERGLDPLTTNLLVADMSRTDKTICLAVSPSLKQYGIPGRARLFEAIQKVKEGSKEPACQGRREKRHRSNPCVRKIPRRPMPPALQGSPADAFRANPTAMRSWKKTPPSKSISSLPLRV